MKVFNTHDMVLLSYRLTNNCVNQQQLTFNFCTNAHKIRLCMDFLECLVALTTYIGIR